jgi:uncharacterized SAM-binding protein YcdF (DUF218 family)
MYFIFSKVLLFLITPFFWVIVLLIIGIISKKTPIKKRLFISSAIVFLLFSNPFLLRRFARLWNYLPNNVTGNYSCAILLGGFASEDAKGTGFFNAACDRFIEAAELKTTGKVNRILISSGNSSLNPDGFREADWVKKEFSKLNIPDSAILVEPNSRNTFENAEFSKKVLETKHLAPPYVLVTGAYHMRRAMYIFKKAGVAVIPYPAEYFSVYEGFSFTEFIPNLEVLSIWSTYTKEIVGYMVAFFK